MAEGVLYPPAAAPSARAERRADRLAQAEIARADRAADRAARLQEQRQRAEDARTDRREKAEQAAAAKADRRTARAERLQALSEWASEHQIDLMLAPLVGVPGWLGWDAMSGFGAELYGGPGHALPVLSEAGMWLFDFAIIRARRKNPVVGVWHLYAGMAVFAGICAALNFMHGKLGPIPGTIHPGPAAGLVYALISVSGIIAHQIVEFGGRSKAAAKTTATAEVAPQDEIVAPEDEGATNTHVARHLIGPLGRPLLPVVALSGPPATPASDGATKGDLDRALADLDREAAARKRAQRENAELRQQLAEALRGDSGKNNNGDDSEKPKRGAKQAMMRAYWEAQIAAGKIPTGADLNRVTDDRPDYALGKRYASEWRNELPTEFAGQFTGNQQEVDAQEESTSTGLPGAA